MLTYRTGLDALGDGTRMAIFQRLATGPMAVHELAEMLPLSRPAVSQHLRVLKDAGLNRDSKEETRRVYQVDPAGSLDCARTLTRCGTRRCADPGPQQVAVAAMKANQFPLIAELVIAACLGMAIFTSRARARVE
jgi:DNA-binding transcriptional ArsR family regulator